MCDFKEIVLWRRYLLQWWGRRNEVNPNTYPHAAFWQHLRSDFFTKWLRVISVMTHSIHSFIKRKNLTSSQTIFTSSHWHWFMHFVCNCVCFHFHTMKSDVDVIRNPGIVHGWLWLSDSLAITHSAHTLVVASTA